MLAVIKLQLLLWTWVHLLLQVFKLLLIWKLRKHSMQGLIYLATGKTLTSSVATVFKAVSSQQSVHSSLVAIEVICMSYCPSVLRQACSFCLQLYGIA
jgi:hypothetical protein